MIQEKFPTAFVDLGRNAKHSKAYLSHGFHMSATISGQSTVTELEFIIAHNLSKNEAVY